MDVNRNKYKKMQTQKFLPIIFILSLLILNSCAQKNNFQGSLIDDNKSNLNFNGSYKIGVMLALTGDAATYGLPEQQSIKIAADEINSKGGINGKKLEMIYEDGKCNPKDGNAAAQKLINIDKVKVIIGGSCSGETLGASPIAESNKVILISPSSTSPDITKAGDFIFRVAPSDAKAGIVASDYAFNELKSRKAALITEAADYPQGIRKVFKENFAKLGGQIVADETYNPEDTDFRTQVTKAKAASPDVIYLLPQTPAKGVLLIKQLKEAGVSAKLLSAEVLTGRSTVAESGKDMEGLVGIEQKFDDKNPKAANLLAKYKAAKAEDAPFPGYMAGVYDIAYLLEDAIVKNGYDAEKIKGYLYAVKDYNGAVGKLTLDENGDPVMEYSILQIKNGNLVPIK